MRRMSLAFLTGFTIAGAAIADEVVVTEQSPDELVGGWVLGAGVDSPDGERIGSIDDFIIVEGEGQISAAIISVGGFLGFGAKSIAVDWSELEINWDAREVVLNMSREEMEDAEEYVFRDREDMPLQEGGLNDGAMDGGVDDGGMDGGDTVGGN